MAKHTSLFLGQKMRNVYPSTGKTKGYVRLEPLKLTVFMMHPAGKTREKRRLISEARTPNLTVFITDPQAGVQDSLFFHCALTGS